MTTQITLTRSTSMVGVDETLSVENFDSLGELFETLKNKYSLPVTEGNEAAISEKPYTEFRMNEFINSGDAAYGATVTYQITIG
jgi:hypothetical protein